MAELARLQEEIILMRNTVIMAMPCWIAGIKSAVSVLGYGTGKPVSPLQPLTEEEQLRVEAFVSSRSK